MVPDKVCSAIHTHQADCSSHKIVLDREKIQMFSLH